MDTHSPVTLHLVSFISHTLTLQTRKKVTWRGDSRARGWATLASCEVSVAQRRSAALSGASPADWRAN
jgi:hypothetical protein